MVIVTSLAFVYMALDESIHSPFEYRLFAPQLWVSLGIILISFTTNPSGLMSRFVYVEEPNKGSDNTNPTPLVQPTATNSNADTPAPRPSPEDSTSNPIEQADKLYTEVGHFGGMEVHDMMQDCCCSAAMMIFIYF